MNKGIILFQSKYGATKKYVQWLQEKTGFDLLETKNADISKVQNYETVILAGGIYASGIAGLSFLKKNISACSGKKIAVFAVGASPYDKKAIAQIRDLHFQKELKDVPLFYGRGAWNEDQMSLKDRTLCRMLKKMVGKKDPADYEPWEAALMAAAGKNCDWTDPQYLEPLLAYLDQKGGSHESL